MSQVERAVVAVERTEAAVAAAKVRQRQGVKDAHARRNAALAQASKVLQAAQAAYDEAVATITKEYEASVAAGVQAVEDANQAYAEACATAEPLLQALKSTTERVSAVAALLRR